LKSIEVRKDNQKLQGVQGLDKAESQGQNVELALNAHAEAATTELSKEMDPAHIGRMEYVA